MQLRHASLFSGIGGACLASRWAGWRNVFQVEIDPWCQKLLAKRFPETDKHLDVKQFDGTQYKGTVDIISGGFPCQPYSTAGKQLGTEDDRHLWPEMLRIIRNVQPRYVVGENVRGLVSWNGGLVFDEVQADLEAAGYEVLPFLLPACAINAPHRRDRIWFVAKNANFGTNGGLHATRGQSEFGNVGAASDDGVVAYSVGARAWSESGEVGNKGWLASQDRREGLRQTHGAVGASGTDTTSTHGFTAHPNGYGQHERNRQHEVQPSKGGEYAQRNVGESGSNGPNTHAESTRLEGARGQELQGRDDGLASVCENDKYATDTDGSRLQTPRAEQQTARLEQHGELGERISTDTDSDFRPEGRLHEEQPQFSESNLGPRNAPRDGRYTWHDFPSESPIRGGNDGLPPSLDRHRVQRLKGLGNAWVPQLAYRIFQVINQMEAAHD